MSHYAQVDSAVPPLSQARSHLQFDIREAEAHLSPTQPRPQNSPAYQLPPVFLRQRNSHIHLEYQYQYRHMPLHSEQPRDQNCADRIRELHRYYDEQKRKVMVDYEAGKERSERVREIKMEGAKEIKNRTNMIKYKDSVNFDWRDAYDLNEHKKDIALQKIKTDRRQEMIGVFENSRSDELRRRLRLRRREEMENEPLPLYEGVLPTYEDVVRGMGEMRG